MKIETYKQQQSNDRNKREKSAGNQMNLIIKNAPKISSLSVESPIHPKTTRTALESAKNTLNKSQIQQLIAENLFLQQQWILNNNTSKIIRGIKQCLTCNQLIYCLKMKCRKLEYEQLIHQKQKESELQNFQIDQLYLKLNKD